MNVNRPSIFGRTLHIPLPFWFTESTFNALPLLSLQYQECEIQVIFNPISTLYQVNDASGNRVAPGSSEVCGSFPQVSVPRTQGHHNRS